MEPPINPPTPERFIYDKCLFCQTEHWIYDHMRGFNDLIVIDGDDVFCDHDCKESFELVE